MYSLDMNTERLTKAGVKFIVKAIIAGIGSSSSVETRNTVGTTPRFNVSNAETIAYQKREIGKELLLLERHLQQGCKIAGKPCGCCQKHPLTIEALAEETLGMTGESVYKQLIEWTRSIQSATTGDASASGKYDSQYPQLAVKARAFRKQIMENEAPMAVLSPEAQAQMSPEMKESLRQKLG